MKIIRDVIFISFNIFITCLSGCSNYDLFPEKVISFKGRVVEAFDSTKPIDSVLVQGCTQPLSLFPTWPSCETFTYTDMNGHFYISVRADDLTSRGIFYSKEGYESLDSCIILGNGEMECYLRPLPTVLTIYSHPKTNIPFFYDSLVLNLTTEIEDTSLNFITKSYIDIYSDTIYYWTNVSSTSNILEGMNTYIFVPDNSKVGIKASYFKDGIFKKEDMDTLYCEKGIGNDYIIIDN